jgi:hypothetical protein
MGQKSNYHANLIADFILGNGAAPTPPANWYYILSTAAFDPAATGSACNEVGAGLGYSRPTVANNSTEWPNATGDNPRTKSNANAVNFGTATGSWGSVQSIYLCDAASGGNIWYGVDITPVTVGVGSGAHVASGAFVVDEY